MSEPNLPPNQGRGTFASYLERTDLPSCIRALVADSHDITLAGTCEVLSRTPHITVVAKATTAADAMAVATSHTLDLALLELRFTDGQGSEVCRHLHASSPDTRVIILADTIDEESAVSALHAGAAAILDKSIEETSLVRAIDAVCCGHMVWDRRIMQPLITHLSEVSNQASGKARTEFSNQERQVMWLVAEGKTNKEIAQALGLTNKTVKNRLSTLYEKLRVTRRTQATKMFIERAREIGIPGMGDFG